MEKILKLLKEDEIKLFELKKVEKGNILYHEGELCDVVGIVDSGEIEIVSYTKSGREIVYTHLSKGMMFGNNLAFSSEPHFKGNVIALNIATVYIIKKEKIVQIFQQNKDFLLYFLKYQSDMGKTLNSQIRLLSLDGAEERFAYYIYVNGGVIRYNSITQLASILHLQRETLSRLISRLVKEGRIIKGNHVIKVNS